MPRSSPKKRTMQTLLLFFFFKFYLDVTFLDRYDLVKTSFRYRLCIKIRTYFDRYFYRIKSIILKKKKQQAVAAITVQSNVNDGMYTIIYFPISTIEILIFDRKICAYALCFVLASELITRV